MHRKGLRTRRTYGDSGCLGRVGADDAPGEPANVVGTAQRIEVVTLTWPETGRATRAVVEHEDKSTSRPTKTRDRGCLER